MDAARIAERSYTRLSKIFGHSFKERKAIILYASHDDFYQTNTAPTTWAKDRRRHRLLTHRNTLPLTGAYDDNHHVLTHEMTTSSNSTSGLDGRGGAASRACMQVQAPTMVFARASRSTSRWARMNLETAMWLRDAALENKLPRRRSTCGPVGPLPVRPRALVAYIGERWGDEAIGDDPRGSPSGGDRQLARRVPGLKLRADSQPMATPCRRSTCPRSDRESRRGPSPTGAVTEKRERGPSTLPRHLARRQPGRLLQRAELLLRRHVAGRRKTGEGQATDPPTSHNSNYETYPVGISSPPLVGGWTIPRLFREARTARQPRHRGVRDNKKLQKRCDQLNGVRPRR